MPLLPLKENLKLTRLWVKTDKNRFESDLQAAITNAEQEVAFIQAEVDRLNATLKKLLDAYAAE